MAVPSSTYRLQINAEFSLADAAALCDYLADLGVGAVYCSPLLAAACGSAHGYDVVDHSHIDAARGGSQGWRALLAAARGHGLGVVVDIVPNHMGIEDAAQNAAWWDVLRLGRESAYAPWFDIEWSQGRLQLPVLGDDFNASQLEVVDQQVRYFDHRFPLAPNTGAGPASEVHARQAYELVNFRRADTDLNYRRFFAVTSLAGLRVEDEAVFVPTHREILRWVNEDGIDGLRVDHPDGLADPPRYLERLAEAAPRAWITVEKILEPGEELPDWPVAGTTGYDALTEVSNVLVDPLAEPEFSRLYQELTGDDRSYREHVAAGKRLQVTTILQAEVKRLARLVPDVANAEVALAELLVAFPVYRSYLPIGQAYLDEAMDAARQRRPDLAAAFGSLSGRLADQGDELARRFQQTSGAVMAKGVEDTVYYRYSRFIALNEVGGDPSQFGAPVAAFHAAQARRQRRWPQSMTTLSTHDTKRSEDVRARLFVLTELPGEWATLARGLVRAFPTPNPAFGYLLWQTFAGAGFIERGRMRAYAEKAMREAADGTGWIDPDASFEAAVHATVDAAYDDPSIREPLSSFLGRIAPFARSNSLSQKLIAFTAPGIPDIYQGTELEDDSLVDPDNRRPIDFDARRALLRNVATGGSPGDNKLAITVAALRLRRDRPGLFAGYTPITASGSAAQHALSFDRGGVIAVATRLPVALAAAGGWGDTTIELPYPCTDQLTGRSYSGRIRLSDLLAGLPVALLADRSSDD
jgi:(1->4)-alpha-D-glucan 1-alpha-D-glucosylmutase